MEEAIQATESTMEVLANNMDPEQFELLIEKLDALLTHSQNIETFLTYILGVGVMMFIYGIFKLATHLFGAF